MWRLVKSPANSSIQREPPLVGLILKTRVNFSLGGLCARNTRSNPVVCSTCYMVGDFLRVYPIRSEAVCEEHSEIGNGGFRGQAKVS